MLALTPGHAPRSVLTTMDRPAALVLARVPGRPLAAKPDLVSLLRCRWAPGCAFAAPWVARVAAGVAAALAHLHSLGVSRYVRQCSKWGGRAWVACVTAGVADALAPLHGSGLGPGRGTRLPPGGTPCSKMPT